MSALVGEPIRPLGPFEVYSSSRHALGFYKCVANTCRYSAPWAGPGGQAIRDVLEIAVANVVLDIPSLSVGIAGEDISNPQFVQRPSINLDDHFEYVEKAKADTRLDHHDSILLSALQDQHDRPWPDIDHQPPWKLTVVVLDAMPVDGLLAFDAVFAVHHAIADGRSTALFHTKLLSELNRPSGRPAQLSGRILNTTVTRKLLPPLEELVTFSTSWRFLAQTLWRELGPTWLQENRAAAPWAGKTVTLEPCRTLLRLVTVPAAAVPHILAACRANRTTLTPLLHALALASLAGGVPAEEALAFCSSTPIDLRPFINKDSQLDGGLGLFGVHVTTQSHTFGTDVITTLREEPSTGQIWRIAADLRRSMEQHLGNLPRDDIIGMLSWVTDWQKFWLSKVGRPRQNTWEVSNIGAMLGGHGEVEEGSGCWKIQRSLMSQGASVTGAAISINVAGVVEGEINIVLGWQKDIVEEKTVDGLARDLQGWLDRLGRGQQEFIRMEC